MCTLSKTHLHRGFPVWNKISRHMRRCLASSLIISALKSSLSQVCYSELIHSQSTILPCNHQLTTSEMTDRGESVGWKYYICIYLGFVMCVTWQRRLWQRDCLTSYTKTVILIILTRYDLRRTLVFANLIPKGLSTPNKPWTRPEFLLTKVVSSGKRTLVSQLVYSQYENIWSGFGLAKFVVFGFSKFQNFSRS